MNLCEWNNAYTKINNKIKKKSPLTSEEIAELTELLDKLTDYINKIGFEVMKRQ